MELNTNQEIQWQSVPQLQQSSEIYVVDDDEIFGKFMLKLLKSQGYEVRYFKTALEFLTRIRSQSPAVIILDVYMSWINGMDLAKTIRKNPRLKDIPIMMITGYPNPEIRVRGFKAGADAFLEKPFGTGELMETLDALLEKKTQRTFQ